MKYAVKAVNYQSTLGYPIIKKIPDTGFTVAFRKPNRGVCLDTGDRPTAELFKDSEWIEGNFTVVISSITITQSND